MTVSLPARSLTIPLDATPTDQLAHLSRLKRSVVGTQAAKAAALQAGGVDRCVKHCWRQSEQLTDPSGRSLVALLQPRTGPDVEASLAVSAEAANVLAALSIRKLSGASSPLPRLTRVSHSHHRRRLDSPHRSRPPSRLPVPSPCRLSRRDRRAVTFVPLQGHRVALASSQGALHRSRQGRRSEAVGHGCHWRFD